MFKILLAKMDALICLYLGLVPEESKPKDVRLVGHKLVVTHTSSFKRHEMKSHWDEFNHQGMGTVSPENLEKLGVAAGKAVANQFVISFKDPKVRINSHV